MRITNKIMQRNNLTNINNNKVYQDSLSTQMSTQKKISRASDDPVVAIRALRLRSNVTEVTQYYSKNIPDAKSWLDITESALKNQSDVMTDMISQCTKGANGDLTSEDRGIILDQLKALSKEVYSTANADYAGRYVFTGYRTDTPLSFVKAHEQTYEIKEQLDRNSLSTVTKVESGNVLGWTSANYDSLDKTNEQSVEAVDAYRIQLAYSECSTNVTPTIRYRDANGELREMESTLMRSYESDPSPYKAAADDDDAVIYVPETGEVLFGKNQYQKLMEVKDDVSTSKDEGQIQVIYQKDSWVSGDLRPEHYFYCKSDPGTADEIEYNNSLKNGKDETYNDYVAQREQLRKDVQETQEKYPDVTYITVKDLEATQEINEKISALNEESASLLAEKEAAGTTQARKEEIDARWQEITEEGQALVEEMNELYSHVVGPDSEEEIVVHPYYYGTLGGQIQRAEEKVDTYEEEQDELSVESASLDAEYGTLNDEYESATDERKAEIEARKAEIESRKAEIESRNEELDEKLADAREQRDELYKKRNDLNAMDANLTEIYHLTDEITFMDGDYENQAIEYDVGFNQTIRVNSTAGECFQHGIGRTVDDLVASLEEVTELDQIRTKIKNELNAAQEGTDAAKILKTQYDAADKSLTLAKEKTQKMFESGITTFQRYLDDVSLSITNCGNRSKKLELIENRMQDQKTTFETLRSENEDVDISETAIQLTSAQLTYEAALMATGKVSQNSLLQYI